MFYKIIRFFLVINFFITSVAFAGRFSDVGEWININPSPRAAGVGVAFYGISKGAHSSLFNPGAPSFMKEREIKAHHGIHIADINYDSIAYFEPDAGKGSANFIVQYFGTDEMQEISKGVLKNKFRSYDIAINLGYANPISERLSAGINFKVILSKLGNYSAQGFGADIGVMGNPFKNTFCGISFQNISSPMTYGNISEYLPFSISAGISQTLKAASEEVDLTFALGAKYMDYKEWEIGVGLEHTAFGQVSIRAGYQYNSMDNRLELLSNLSAGLGVNISGILVDYAWVPYGEMGYTHRFGLGYRFKAAPKLIKGIIIKLSPSLYSPSAANLSIKVTWLNIENSAKWTIEITDAEDKKVRTIQGSGKFREYFWDGKDEIKTVIEDGKYKLRLVVEPNKGEKVYSNIEDIVIDSTPPEFEIKYSTGKFSPNGDGIDDVLKINVGGLFTAYKLKIFDASGKMVKEFIGEPLSKEMVWDGKDDYYEKIVSNGDYTIMAQARDATGNVTVLPVKKITVHVPLPKMKRIKVLEEERGLKINLKSKVLFTTGKGVLKQGSYESLDEVVTLINAYPENKILIEGHTDSVGSSANNKKLSLKRANAIKKYVVNKGINKKRIKVVGWGEEKPIASNRTRAGRTTNRRVEIIILKEKVK